jgi:hypothetical protein
VQHVFQIEWCAQRTVTHAPACSIGDLAILHVKTGARKTLDRSGVIVMQVGENHVAHLFGFDIEKP